MNTVGTTLSLSETPAFLQSVLGLEGTTTLRLLEPQLQPKE
jgi:hypothetical protein